MAIKNWLPLFVIAGLMSCQNTTQNKQKEASATVLSPEETVKKFQLHIDNNNFPDAIRMSTQDMQKVLSSLKELFTDDTDEVGLTQTTFLDIQCKTEKELAECRCQLRDEYEDYNSVFFLKKIKGIWLIDRSEDSYSEEDEESKVWDSEVE